MALLFSYGTLRDQDVQREIFGRTLVGRRATLVGYKMASAAVSDPDFARKSGRSQHAILRPSNDPEARVDGVALEVTRDDLEYVDRYEPAEYVRVLAKLASGQEVWVYVAKG